jgi:serine protease Do
MSMRSSSLAVGLVFMVGGAAAWFGLSRSQTQLQPAPAPQAQNFNQSRSLLENERNTIDIVQRTNDGVVFIAVRSAPQASNTNDFFGQFFQQQPSEGEGSGFVIDQEGLILTNFHVVGEPNAAITVRFHNDPRSYPAKVVGTAEPFDIALIRVQAPKNKLRPMVLGNSDQVRVGQKTLALGNPFGLESTVTEGIVSAVRRNPNDGGSGRVGEFVPTVIQSDAAINPGNSGGPLLNSQGQVIGINSFIYSTTGSFGGAAQSAGIGFAIPINLAKQYLSELKAGKQISVEDVVNSRPRLGVSLARVSMGAYPATARQQGRLPDTGLMIAEVTKGGPADRAGLRSSTRNLQVSTRQGTVELPANGDIILEADGNPIDSINDLRAVLVSKTTGQAVSLKVWRGGQTLNVQVVPQIIR